MPLKERIVNNRIINNLLLFAQTASLPGFGNVSLYNVGLFFFEEIMRDSINIRAASIAYNLFLAFFPLTIFLFTLIPYIPIDNLEAELLHFMNELLPDYTYKTIEATIQDIVNIPRRGLTSVGFLLALFFASNGVSSMIEAFEKDNSAFKNEVFYIKKLKAIGITILLTLILLVTIVLIIGGQLVLNKIITVLNIEDGIVHYLLLFVQFLTFFFLTLNSIALIYYLAPSVKDRWSFFSPGVTFTTVVVLLTTYGFTFFINNFNSYNRVYGSIGAIMAVMLLIYLFSLFLIIGFELNASIALNKSLGNKLDKKILTPDDFL